MPPDTEKHAIQQLASVHCRQMGMIKRMDSQGSGQDMSVDRDTAYLLPASVQEWLPGNHLARFVAEIVEQLDLSELTRA